MHRRLRNPAVREERDIVGAVRPVDHNRAALHDGPRRVRAHHRRLGLSDAPEARHARAVRLDPICAADCDGSGALDVFDFLCFQNRFAAAAPAADCDGSGELDFFDFLCFQTAFGAGCD